MSRRSRGRAQAVPIHIKEANASIAKYHPNRLPTVGGKFAVQAVHRGTLAGVALAGRAVARRLDDGKTIEVLRVCADGTRNCCSFLFDRVAKIARLLGHTKVITYTLEQESGASAGRWVGELCAGSGRGSSVLRAAAGRARRPTARRSSGGNFEREGAGRAFGSRTVAVLN